MASIQLCELYGQPYRPRQRRSNGTKRQSKVLFHLVLFIYLVISLAGLSSSLPEQLKQILEVVTTALRSVSSAHRASIQRQIQDKKAEDLRRIQDAHKRQAIISGTWHDGRLDCVSGNGVISELGVGDELFSEDMEAVLSPAQLKETTEDQDNILRKQKALEDVEAIKALPIVVIRNYAAGTSSKEDVLDVLAQWGAALAENHVSSNPFVFDAST